MKNYLLRRQKNRNKLIQNLQQNWQRQKEFKNKRRKKLKNLIKNPHLKSKHSTMQHKTKKLSPDSSKASKMRSNLLKLYRRRLGNKKNHQLLKMKRILLQKLLIMLRRDILQFKRLTRRLLIISTG